MAGLTNSINDYTVERLVVISQMETDSYFVWLHRQGIGYRLFEVTIKTNVGKKKNQTVNVSPHTPHDVTKWQCDHCFCSLTPEPEDGVFIRDLNPTENEELIQSLVGAISSTCKSYREDYWKPMLGFHNGNSENCHILRATLVKSPVSDPRLFLVWTDNENAFAGDFLVDQPTDLYDVKERLHDPRLLKTWDPKCMEFGNEVTKLASDYQKIMFGTGITGKTFSQLSEDSMGMMKLGECVESIMNKAKREWEAQFNFIADTGGPQIVEGCTYQIMDAYEIPNVKYIDNVELIHCNPNRCLFIWDDYGKCHYLDDLDF